MGKKIKGGVVVFMIISICFLIGISTFGYWILKDTGKDLHKVSNIEVYQIFSYIISDENRSNNEIWVEFERVAFENPDQRIKPKDYVQLLKLYDQMDAKKSIVGRKTFYRCTLLKNYELTLTDLLSDSRSFLDLKNKEYAKKIGYVFNSNEYIIEYRREQIKENELLFMNEGLFEVLRLEQENIKPFFMGKSVTCIWLDDTKLFIIQNSESMNENTGENQSKPHDFTACFYKEQANWRYFISEEVNFLFNQEQVEQFAIKSEKDYGFYKIDFDETGFRGVLEYPLITSKLFRVQDSKIELMDGIYDKKKCQVLDLETKEISTKTPDFYIGQENYSYAIDEQRNEIVGMIEQPLIPYRNVRVMLKDYELGTVYLDEAKISCDVAFEIYEKNELLKTVNANEEVLIRASDFVGRYPRIRFVKSSETGKYTVSSLKRQRAKAIYEGDLDICYFEEKNKIIISNELAVERYLRMVVPSEMPQAFGLEALKAQSVAARTYVYSKIFHSNIMNLGAHVDDSAAYQVYGNIESNETSNEAIEATKDQVLLLDKELAGAYYYSTSCGFGTNASVWGASDENTNHLVAKQISIQPEEVDLMNTTDEEWFSNYITQTNENDYEQDTSFYRWTYATTLDENYMLEQLIKRYQAASDQILIRNDNGEFVSKEPTKLGKIHSIQVRNRVLGGCINELLIEGEDATYLVQTEHNVRYILANIDKTVILNNKREYATGAMIPSAFCVIKPTYDGEIMQSYQVFGGGFGHGLGMSQSGAAKMGKSSYTYQEILQFFYENTELTSIDSRE